MEADLSNTLDIKAFAIIIRLVVLSCTQASFSRQRAYGRFVV